MVLLGWQHFNNDKSKYCSVRQASGGGVRKVFFPNNALKTDILEKAKFLFFPRVIRLSTLEIMQQNQSTINLFSLNILTIIAFQNHVNTSSLKQ